MVYMSQHAGVGALSVGSYAHIFCMAWLYYSPCAYWRRPMPKRLVLQQLLDSFKSLLSLIFYTNIYTFLYEYNRVHTSNPSVNFSSAHPPNGHIRCLNVRTRVGTKKEGKCNCPGIVAFQHQKFSSLITE